MRFAMEMARVSVITILTGTLDTRETLLAGISGTMRQWRQKCSAQIDLLGVCVMTKALESRDGAFSNGPPSHCSFRLDTDKYITPLAYITPGCLVYVYENNGMPATVHDPCQFYDCTLPGLYQTFRVQLDIINVPQTLLKYNPLNMVDPLEVRGKWSKIAPLNVNQSTYDVFLAKVEEWHSDLTRDMPGRLTDVSLFRRALLNEERSGIGSPNPGGLNAPYGTPLKTATERSGETRHCDMMVVSAYPTFITRS